MIPSLLSGLRPLFSGPRQRQRAWGIVKWAFHALSLIVLLFALLPNLSFFYYFFELKPCDGFGFVFIKNYVYASAVQGKGPIYSGSYACAITDGEDEEFTQDYASMVESGKSHNYSLAHAWALERNKPLDFAEGFADRYEQELDNPGSVCGDVVAELATQYPWAASETTRLACARAVARMAVDQGDENYEDLVTDGYVRTYIDNYSLASAAGGGRDYSHAYALALAQLRPGTTDSGAELPQELRLSLISTRLAFMGRRPLDEELATYNPAAYRKFWAAHQSNGCQSLGAELHLFASALEQRAKEGQDEGRALDYSRHYIAAYMRGQSPLATHLLAFGGRYMYDELAEDIAAGNAEWPSFLPQLPPEPELTAPLAGLQPPSCGDF